jgi:hypothetical protein
MTSRTAILLLAAAVLGAASPARSDSIRFCIRINAEYQDNARGEDQWTCGGDLRCRLGVASGYPDPANDPDDAVRFQTFRGGLVEIWEGSSTSGRKLTNVFNDYFLGDGTNNDSGCTGWLTPTSAAGDYLIKVWSEGKARDDRWHYIAIDSANSKRSSSHVRNFGAGSNNTTETVFLMVGRYDNDPNASASDKEKRRVFQQGNAAAFGMKRDTMGVSGVRLVVKNRNTNTGGASGSVCREDWGAQFGWFVPYECLDMNLDTSDKKAVVTHELGHLLSRLSSGYGFPNRSEAYSGPDGPQHCIANASGHKMRSIEFQGKALYEGLAHAYSARVWSTVSTGPAPYYYDGNDVDLARDTPATSEDPWFTQPFMTEWCTDVTSFSGLGNELDWARTFWMTYVVDPSGDTSFAKICDVIGASGGWDDDNAYSRLNARMNSSATNTTLKNAWNSAKVVNEINFP